MSAKPSPKKNAHGIEQPEELAVSPAVIAARYKMRQRFEKSGYFFGALLLHLILFIMLATFVLFHMQAPPPEVKFLPVAIKPPPPPVIPPPPPGGDSANAEPDVNIEPPPMMPSIITTDMPVAVNVTSVKVPVPNMDFTLSTHESGKTAGHGSGRGGHGFGSDVNDPTLLVGYLYDFKQKKDRTPTEMDPGKMHDLLAQFISSGWDESLLEPYYKSPKPLSTSYIFIPTLNADDGPKAFGVEKDVKPRLYAILYKASVTPKQDGNYRFVGVADDILLVRVNGQTELDGCASWQGAVWPERANLKDYNYDEKVGFTPSWGADAHFFIGKPFAATANQKVDIEVIMGEQPGGKSNYFLFIQRDEDLHSYKKLANGNPTLPIFQLDNDPIKPEGDPGTWPPFAPTPEPWVGVGTPK